MPYIKVNPDTLASVGSALQRTARRVSDIENDFSRTARKLDWEIRDEGNLNRRIDNISQALEKITKSATKMRDFVSMAKATYSTLEQSSPTMQSTVVPELGTLPNIHTNLKGENTLRSLLNGLNLDYRNVSAVVTEYHIEKAVIKAFNYRPDRKYWSSVMEENVNSFLENAVRTAREDGGIELAANGLKIVITPYGELAQVYELDGDKTKSLTTYYSNGTYEKAEYGVYETKKSGSVRRYNVNWDYENYETSTSISFLNYNTKKGKSFEVSGKKGAKDEKEIPIVEKGDLGSGDDAINVFSIGAAGDVSLISIDAELKTKDGKSIDSSVDIGKLSLGAKMETGVDPSTGLVLMGELGAEALIAEVDLGAGKQYEFLGVKLDVKASGTVGAGATAKAGCSSEGFGIKIGAAYGFGAALEVNVDASEFIESTQKKISSFALDLKKIHSASQIKESYILAM